jgi:signal peptidase I
MYPPVQPHKLPKDPWLAVNLSLFFPGIGQLYAEKLTKACLWFLAEVGLITFALWSIFTASGNITQGLIALTLALIFYLGNILDAHLSVYGDRQDSSLEKIPRKHKNPWFAIFASRILPGLGHIYSNQSSLGLIILTLSLILLRLDDFFPALAFFAPLLAAFAIYHNYLIFPHQYHPHKHSQRKILLLMVGVIFSWGIICNYFPSWFSRQLAVFSIPSESMQPTLQIGDRIFVRESLHNQPHRGDVVVFHPPQQARELVKDAGDYYIKRIIGEPQETLEVKNGQVFINNQPLQEDYISYPPQYQWGPQVIPPQHYFVLGDNRNASFDSHEWGFLPAENLVGQAYKIYWPLERSQSLLR